MNLRHVGYRAYQCVFGLGARLLPWRQPETITGPGSLADIPARLTRYGARRPLVVASRRQCADPAFRQILSRLEGYTLFSDIQPNPPVSTVEAAAALYRQAHCDSLVAVGGGSPMDTAKAAAALTRPPRFKKNRSSTVNQWQRCGMVSRTKSATSSIDAPDCCFLAAR